MDQDQRKDAILEKVQAHQSLELVKLDPELAQTDAETFQLRAYNWRSEHFRKIWCQRHTTYEPPLNTLKVIMYPKMHFDAPIFLILFVVTERRVMVHFNVNTPLEDDDYKAKWVDPLTAILKTYPAFDGKGKYPEWLLPFRQPCAVRGMHEHDQLDDLTSCVLEYLDVYFSNLATCEPIDDPGMLAPIEAHHKKFITAIRTEDPALEILKHFMSERLIRRHFQEVAT